MADGAELGPVNNKPQYDRVTELVSEALAGGATAAAGGAALDRPGYFFASTVLARVSDGVRIVDEEQFGLGGSAWAADPGRAARAAEQLETGTAWINTHSALAPHQPFGGSKWSGIGVEHGPWGLLGFTEMQVIYRFKA